MFLPIQNFYIPVKEFMMVINAIPSELRKLLGNDIDKKNNN